MNDMQLIISLVSFVILFLSWTCRYLCNSSDSPHSVTATATETIEDSTTPQPYPQQYPQHLTAVPGLRQSYQGVPYQPVPEQPGYSAQPGDPAPCDNPAEPLPNYEQLFTLQLLPSYQDATGPGYPLQPMPSSPPVYLLNPLAQPQPSALPDSIDFLTQSTCSPEFVLH